MQINENTIIKCESQTEVSTCLNMLKDLGFETFYKENDYELLVAAVFVTTQSGYFFTSFKKIEITSENNLISFETFQKLYNKQIKEKKELDLVVDNNGKVLKVNNIDSLKKAVYFNIKKGIKMFGFKKTFFYQDYYNSEDALEKALKRKEIENKLKLLAFELNGNRNITEEEWKKSFIKKCYLYYNHYNNTIRMGDDIFDMNQGSIYCLSIDFKDKAIELIGEKDLKEYLINY